MDPPLPEGQYFRLENPVVRQVENGGGSIEARQSKLGH
jgi:hypothetical protein